VNDEKDTLTDKQRRFVEEYLIDLNATQAAIRAGYSPDSARLIGCENLTKPNIASAVSGAMQKRSEAVQIDSYYVLSTIKETVERCKQAHPVLDRKGEQVYVKVGDGDEAEMKPAFTFDANAVLKGAELLGRHIKMFTDKLDINARVTTLAAEIAALDKSKE